MGQVMLEYLDSIDVQLDVDAAEVDLNGIGLAALEVLSLSKSMNQLRAGAEGDHVQHEGAVVTTNSSGKPVSCGRVEAEEDPSHSSLLEIAENNRGANVTIGRAHLSHRRAKVERFLPGTKKCGPSALDFPGADYRHQRLDLQTLQIIGGSVIVGHAEPQTLKPLLSGSLSGCRWLGVKRANQSAEEPAPRHNLSKVQHSLPQRRSSAADCRQEVNLAFRPDLGQQAAVGERAVDRYGQAGRNAIVIQQASSQTGMGGVEPDDHLAKVRARHVHAL